MTSTDTRAGSTAAGDADPTRRRDEPARDGFLRSWFPSMLLIALVSGFYATTTSNPFASDDYLLVDIASKGLAPAMSYHGGYHFIPAGMALLALEHAAWGTTPAGYHWTSIALLALTGRLVVAFVTPVVVIGAATASVRKLLWAEAGIVAEQLLDDATTAIGAHPRATMLYVVDLPDGFDLGESEPAYIFRFGFETAMRWRFPERTFGVIRLRSEHPPERTEPFGTVTGAQELAALAANPDNLVMHYDPRIRRLTWQRP